MKQAATSVTGAELLSAKAIYKSFCQNEVLKGINLSLNGGEVLALIGGNGAGKSTLMKILMGIYQPDKGEIEVCGKKVNLLKPSTALSHGIYMVPQEPMLFPNMTVEENILIGFKEKHTELHKRLINIMKEVGWNLDLYRKASSLSIAEQQLVEILRGLLRNSKILILDEPTSALTFDEVESLFKCVEGLKQKNIGIIYITHRLTEVFEIATHVAILRDGVVTLSGEVKDFNREMLVKGLLPQNMGNKQQCSEYKCGCLNYEELEPTLVLENFSGYGFDNINLKVYPGEILGVAGVVGAGRTEMAITILGMEKQLGGKVVLDGKDISGFKINKVLEAGINYVPEDRHLNGLFKIASVSTNMTTAILARNTMGKLFIDKTCETDVSQKYIDDFRIKVTGQNQLAGSLSGGNQQKVVIGRSLSTKPKVVILDEPTRGIDAAARGDVYSIIHELKNEGVSILLISSDMEEIVELSDRAVTVFQGRINAEFCKENINQDNLMSAAFGVTEGKRVSK